MGRGKKGTARASIKQFDGNAQSLLGNPDCTPGYDNNEGRRSVAVSA
jgi:hypothetical protein